LTLFIDNKLLAMLVRLWSHLSGKRRRQFVYLLVVTIATSFAEIFTLSATFPFLGILISPSNISLSPLVSRLYGILNIASNHDILLLLTILFGGCAFISGLMRLIQGWLNTRISFAAGADLSVLLYKVNLLQPYAVHVSRNSSVIINAVATKVGVVIAGGIIPALSIIISICMLLSIIIALIVIDPIIAMSAFVGFGFIYVLVIYVTRRRLALNSALISSESDSVVKLLQEGLGGIRDILIDGNQGLYCDLYAKAVYPLRRAEGYNQFISQSPRYAIEALAMIMIASAAYLLSRNNAGITQTIPVLGTLALGAQRMLPSLQQLFMSWSSLNGNSESIRDVLDLLDQQLPNEEGNAEVYEMQFVESISLNNISFCYSGEGGDVINNINLIIKKGEKVGFVGTTGSGKSTLLDIIMGLLSPTKGEIAVDGNIINISNRKSWQRNISHVPQSIYLADTTIVENIAFGVPKHDIDYDRVICSAKNAQIDEVIRKMQKGYQTVIGERGVRLSGGQRQRIGIARALYKGTNILILDEATSALDNKTESAVMKTMDALNKNVTVLIIAHRLSSLKMCDRIVELENGAIKSIGSYETVVLSAQGNK